MSDIDCQDSLCGMNRCFCNNETECLYADKCARYKWRRTDLKIDGLPHCQRPRNEPTEDSD